MSQINNQLLKGSIDIVLLSLLQRGAMYGYQISKELQRISQEALVLKEGSLYPALHRLERDGFICSYWQARPDGVERRYYELTESGRQALTTKKQEWHQFVNVIEGVLAHG